MKGISTWSYRPFRPFLVEVGDIYICRLVVSRNAIHVEWLDEGNGEYEVFYRVRGEGDFLRFATLTDTECDITGLTEGKDYELYVCSGEKKSRVRLARCGYTVGSTVNYLHPEDGAYAFSGHYFGSPSFVRHPDGYLLATMDVFAKDAPQNFALLFRSDDDGKSWHYQCDITPAFWTKIFLHKGEVYLLTCSTEYGDLLIGKSTDGGKSFGAPTVLLRGINGKGGTPGVHKNPQNILYANGRMYVTLEWGNWFNTTGDYTHAVMVASCSEDADIMNPEVWSFTEPVKFEEFCPELEGMKPGSMMIEGTPVQAPDGRLFNVLRFGLRGKAIVFEIDQADHEAPLEFSHLMDFPANFVKFMIKHDPASGYYYTIANVIHSEEKPGARNYSCLLRSADLVCWENYFEIYDYRNEGIEYGFQYVDFEIEGEDILFLCRTAMNGAPNYHDSNSFTFNRIKNFRDKSRISLEYPDTK